MFLTIFTLLSSCALSGFFTYLICIHSAWYYFFLSFLRIIPVWIVLFGLWVLILVIWGLFIGKKEEYGFSKFYYWIVKNTDTWARKLLNVHVRKKGFDKIPNEDCLYIINHNSNFDPRILIEEVRGPLVCVTKPENFSFPIAGPFIKRAGYIDINREDPRLAIKSINKASDILSTKTGNVCICPEGTRNKTNNPLLPFHPGSFKIATKSGCPIVVIDLKHTKQIKKNRPFKPTNIDADVVAVLRKEDYQDKTTKEISDYCYEAILKDLTKEEAAK